MHKQLTDRKPKTLMMMLKDLAAYDGIYKASIKELLKLIWKQKEYYLNLANKIRSALYKAKSKKLHVIGGLVLF